MCHEASLLLRDFHEAIDKNVIVSTDSKGGLQTDHSITCLKYEKFNLCELTGINSKSKMFARGYTLSLSYELIISKPKARKNY